MEDVHCRSAGVEDVPFLATMLGEAAVWRPDKATPTADEVMADPRYAMYLTGWPRQGDFGLVAEQDGPVGAAWYRTYTEANHGYGFVAEDVPELSIAVIVSCRHEGIGRRLLVDLIDASVAQGYSAISLSVAEEIRRVASTSRLASCLSRSTERPGQWSETRVNKTELLLGEAGVAELPHQAVGAGRRPPPRRCRATSPAGSRGRRGTPRPEPPHRRQPRRATWDNAQGAWPPPQPADGPGTPVTPRR